MRLDDNAPTGNEDDEDLEWEIAAALAKAAIEAEDRAKQSGDAERVAAVEDGAPRGERLLPLDGALLTEIVLRAVAEEPAAEASAASAARTAGAMPPDAAVPTAAVPAAVAPVAERATPDAPAQVVAVAADVVRPRRSTAVPPPIPVTSSWTGARAKTRRSGVTQAIEEALAASYAGTAPAAATRATATHAGMHGGGAAKVSDVPPRARVTVSTEAPLPRPRPPTVPPAAGVSARSPGVARARATRPPVFIPPKEDSTVHAMPQPPRRPAKGTVPFERPPADDDSPFDLMLAEDDAGALLREAFAQYVITDD